MLRKRSNRNKLERLQEEHTEGAIADRIAAGPKSSYLKDFVYGAVDGTVTTYALVAGVAGAQLDHSIVLILGFANLIGDGFSMGASNFLGTRAEAQQLEAARKEEYAHIDLFPEGEREEIRQVFSQKGFLGEDLEKIVEVITADNDRWVETMLQEELGLSTQKTDPLRAALSTFFAFFFVGLIPLLPFILKLVSNSSVADPFLISSVMTGITFFAVGAVKGKYVSEHWFLSGIETFFIGGAAAMLAYLIGFFLKAFV